MKLIIYLPYSYKNKIGAPINNRFHEHHFWDIKDEQKLEYPSNIAVRIMTEELWDM
jgi:hypothetical protein